MFFFGQKLHRSKYSRQSLKESGHTLPPTRGALFAERVWFGFMLLFALPFLLPFLLMGAVVKIYKIVFRIKDIDKDKEELLAIKKMYEVKEEENAEASKQEDTDTQDCKLTSHLADIVKEIDSDKQS